MAQMHLAQLYARANQRLRQSGQAKHFIIESDIPCDRWYGPTNRVDLVVLIDTSNSMKDEAAGLSVTAKAVVEAVAPSCHCNLRVRWFGIEGIWEGTQFTQTYRQYLHGMGISDAEIQGRRRGTVANQGAQEDGARAIIDIAQHFDWRWDALRLIVYLGDEALEGGNPKTAEDIKAANDAITTSISQRVKVFTYAGTSRDKVTPNPNTVFEYERLSTATGGRSYVAPMKNLSRLQTDLQEIIRASFEERDRGGGWDDIALVEERDKIGRWGTVVLKTRPCFELHWGNGPQDRIETDDREVLCLSVSNPYTNVTLKDVTVLLAVVTDTVGNPVDILPDGNPSVLIKPSNVICFGDLPPCTSAEAATVTRQVVLISRGAKSGEYLLKIKYRHLVELTQLQGADTFKLELVAS